MVRKPFSCPCNLFPLPFCSIPLCALLPLFFTPSSAQFGFDPIHYAVIIVIAFIIRGVTPPVGLLLYITCGLAKVKLSEVHKTVWPFVALMIAILLLAAYVPSLVLFIPNLFFKR